MLSALKEEIINYTKIVWDFHITLKAMHRSWREKINKDPWTLYNALDQMGLADIYKTFHLKAEEWALLSRAYGTSSMIDHILGYKSSLSKFKKMKSGVAWEEALEQVSKAVQPTHTCTMWARPTACQGGWGMWMGQVVPPEQEEAYAVARRM